MCGLGFRIEGLGFKVRGPGFKVWVLEFRGLRFKIWGFKLRVRIFQNRVDVVSRWTAQPREDFVHENQAACRVYLSTIILLPQSCAYPI